MKEKKENPVEFQIVLEALLDTPTPFPPKYLYQLSDLDGKELSLLALKWLAIDPLRRLRLIEDLEMLSESNTMVLFDPIYKIALSDTDPNVKKTAIRALWESDDKSIGVQLFEILKRGTDDVPVLAQAAAGLGKFVYLSEFEQIPSPLANQITDLLLEKCTPDQPEIIRQRAVEALGFSSDPRIPNKIEDAYNQDTEDWIISALVAMGRSASKQWMPMIIESLSHEEGDVRLEAAQAAGEIGGEEIATHMLHLLDDPEKEVWQAAVWALSEIGGDDAKLALESALMAAKEEDDIQFLEEALDNLDFNEMEFGFEMLDLSEEDLENMIDEEPDELDDLDE